MPTNHDIQAVKIQQELTEQAEAFLFESEENAKNTAQTIADFIDDYLKNGRNQPIRAWLLNRFNQYSDIWENEDEKQNTAEVIVSTVENLVKNQVALNEHLKTGKTAANFLNKKIEQIAESTDTPASEIYQHLTDGLNQNNSQLGSLLTDQAVEFPSEITNSNINNAKQIFEKSLLNAKLNLANYGLRTVGTRLKNALLGKENLSRGEELLNIVRSSIDSAENVGVQVAVAGGFVVSAKKGWVSNVFNGLEQVENLIGKSRAFLNRVQDITLNIGEMWNDFRLSDLVDRGVYTAIDLAGEKAKFAIAKTATALEAKAEQICRQAGAKLGASLGAFAGSLTGNPAVAAVAGKIGAVVGDLGGKAVSDKIVKPMIEVGKKIINKTVDLVTSGAKKIYDAVSSAASSAWNYVKSWF